MNGFDIGRITEDDFKSRDINEQLWFLYKAQEYSQQVQQKVLDQCSCRMESCTKNNKEKDTEYDKRFKKLENRKRFDTAIGAGSGGIGGFLAIILQKVLGL